MILRNQLFAVAGLVLAGLLVAFSANAVPFSSQFFVEDGAITIDNDFSDWPEEGLVIDESEETDIVHDYYCYDLTAEEWSTIEGDNLGPEDASQACPGGFVYSDTGQIDLHTVYFGVNNTNMYLGFEAVWPMMGAWDVDNEEFVDVWQFVPTHGIDSLPLAFDHDMVFAFGPEDEEVYNYYVVAHINLPEDLTTVFDSEGVSEEFTDVELLVYQESGDAVGWDALDEKLGEIETDHGDENEGEECPEEGACEGDDEEDERYLSTAFEVEQNIEAFYTLTGMTPDSYGFRMETHSDVGDVTERVVVSTDVALDAPENLSVRKKAPRKVMLRWDEVEGADNYRVQVRTKKGRLVKTFRNVEDTKRLFGKKFARASRPYKFRVRACGSTEVASCGDWSEYKNFRTVPGKPLNLSATATADGTAEFSWDVPSGKKINWYFLRVRNYDGERVTAMKIMEGTAATVTDLEPGIYSFNVRAVFNKKNTSKFSRTYQFTVPAE